MSCPLLVLLHTKLAVSRDGSTVSTGLPADLLSPDALSQPKQLLHHLLLQLRDSVGNSVTVLCDKLTGLQRGLLYAAATGLTWLAARITS